ncbi:hypothetical protein MVLG_02933 [Microbotryum lychnidis-dioicae p1A1 Lamole]|uniref:Uncharacterized protein n=1 Tax=Microbotryum lychnidis-dioicae (strain p1A1 Lamole / MvSl-1064) TaxID=683840 RepID=U5H6N5_USTV1|nr:hypothetical protein MVLG_02933 [Microbotryum lychnidis-dioicae p1A1 Lamole]|eukprot:KDE06737.1 hypothetical protein MVLG_02933 [Microbotryum lychnidis-dioicae p1A1 Lamole]
MASPQHALHLATVASSLSPTCNPSKHAFDTCFNHWFKSYLVLVSPPLQHPIDTAKGKTEREQRDRLIKEKKDEYDTNCAAVYKEYQECLKAAIPHKEGLVEMLAQARAEEPLHGWGGIKVATKDDLGRCDD